MKFPILQCQTSKVWLAKAIEEQSLLLIDHAHCEKKAASTALSIIYRYAEHNHLIERMSRLAREELRHFEQVLKMMSRREIVFKNLSPSRYARGLHQHVRTHEPAKLIDTLIIGAFVEARSCERFAALIPYFDNELAKFYSGLLVSEARHYQHYIDFARELSGQDIEPRIKFFAEIESELIDSPDQEFRFHSGRPV